MNTDNQLRRPPGVPSRPRAGARNGQGIRPGVKTSYSSGMMSVISAKPPLLRSELGDVLRSLRTLQELTQREVSSQAQVSLGYLSEVERGQKEASSELLESICSALGVPLWFVLREVADRMMVLDTATVPDTVPDDLLAGSLVSNR